MFRINLNGRIVVLNTEMLVSNHKLFQIYILSLLCTENTSKVDINEYNYYSISTQKYWKHLRFTNYYELTELLQWRKNPLKARKPIRVSSSKKIRKFEKEFNRYMSSRIKDPIDLLLEYYELELVDIMHYIKCNIEYEDNIKKYALFLNEFGYDIYSSVEKHL
jgi:hypothetical protein